MSKLMYFILICLSLLGFLGGMAYTLYNEAYFFSGALIVSIYMAWPKMREYASRIVQ